MSHQTPNNVFLGLDIGTNYVKSIIARKPKDGPLEILGAGCVKQSPGAMNAGVIMNIPAVTEACERAIHDAESTSGFSVETVVVGIAGELVKCTTSKVRYERKDSGRSLSDAEMSLVLQQVQDLSREKAAKEIAFELDNPHAEVELINSAVVSVSINGQKVNNPIGFKGTDVSIEFYTAFAPELHVRSIEKVCADLNLELLAIAVDPFAICRACLGDDENADTPAVLIDVGGGNTSIAIVDCDGIRGTTTFSIGAKSIDRDISVWLSGIKIAFEEFEHVETFPSRIFLCGGGADSAELQESLALGDWFEGLKFPRRPVVNLIEISDLPDLKNSTKMELASTFVTSVGLARIAADLMDPEEKSGLKTKISKILKN